MFVFAAIFTVGVQSFCPIQSAPPSLVPRTRISCADQCSNGVVDLNVSYSVFSDLSAQSAGAIYANRMRAFICHSHFYRCAGTQAQGGGMRIVGGTAVHLFAVFALGCNAVSAGAVAQLEADGAGTTIDILETTALENRCASFTIVVGAVGTGRSGVARLENLNFTANLATLRGTGISISPTHYPVTIQFCLFHSNYPASAFRLADAADQTQARDLCRCLFFVNNTATATTEACLIFANYHLLVENSAFAANTMTYFVGAYPDDSTFVVTFENCVFDCAQFEASGLQPPVTESCAIRPASEIPLDPVDCPTPRPTQSPARSLTQTPDPSSTHSPARSPTQSPERSPTQSPEQSPAQSPDRSPTESPTGTNSPVQSLAAPDPTSGFTDWQSYHQLKRRFVRFIWFDLALAC
jgi:hypothetical protein